MLSGRHRASKGWLNQYVDDAAFVRYASKSGEAVFKRFACL